VMVVTVVSGAGLFWLAAVLMREIFTGFPQSVKFGGCGGLLWGSLRGKRGGTWVLEVTCAF
jgi:hypothetical protein